jgi:hypothetical protein
VIQGTFGVIPGTSGVIQGTFGVIQGTFGAIQGTFEHYLHPLMVVLRRAQVLCVRLPHTRHRLVLVRAYLHSGNIRGTFREHSGNMSHRSGNISHRSGNIQGTHQAHGTRR